MPLIQPSCRSGQPIRVLPSRPRPSREPKQQTPHPSRNYPYRKTVLRGALAGSKSHSCSRVPASHYQTHLSSDITSSLVEGNLWSAQTSSISDPYILVQKTGSGWWLRGYEDFSIFQRIQVEWLTTTCTQFQAVWYPLLLPSEVTHTRGIHSRKYPCTLKKNS